MSPGTNSQVSIWRILTIVFGALPATLLSIPAAFGVALGSMGILGGLLSADAEALVFGFIVLPWGGLGIYGMLSLWAVGLSGCPEGWVRTGLALGTVAALPLCVFAIVELLDFDGADGLSALLFFLPPIVAICWLVRFRRRPFYPDKGPGNPTRIVGPRRA